MQDGIHAFKKSGHPFFISIIFVILIGWMFFGWPQIFHFPPEIQQASAATTPITGHAWSDTIGWISMNCIDGGPTGNNICASSNYGLSVDASGNITGYAWSDNLGWVSANESSCPSGTCQPKILGGAMSGWLKALAGGSAESGGWDGWISLSGAGYGPTLQPGGVFSGFAWGSDVVGWVDMQYAHTAFMCQPGPSVCAPDPITGLPNSGLDNGCGFTACPYVSYGYMCNPGTNTCDQPPPITGTFTVSPRIVRAGNSVQVSWNMSNATCTITGSNGDGVLPLWSGTSGTKTSSPINAETIYLLHCDGAIPGFTYDAQVDVSIVPTFKER